MPKRVLLAEISHETNTFSPIPTDLGRFAQRELVYGPAILDRARGTKTGIGGYMDAAAAAAGTGGGVELIPSVAASAVPSGTVTRDAYEHLMGRLLADLAAAKAAPGGLQGIALCLHGAMVAQGLDDAEGDILRRVREAAGPDIPLVSTLDLHGNMTPEMVQNADCLFGYDTNPHIDGYERAVEAFQALTDIWAGRLRPTMHLVKTQMMPATINMRTAEGPMVKLFERARHYEGWPGVRNVSVFGGFPYTDVEFGGLSVLALTDNDPRLAQRIAEDIAALAWEIRAEFLKPIWQPAEAVRHAMAAPGRPIILADVADNMGGGGSGDTTVLLRTLIDLGARDVGFALIVDPESVSRCVAAGPGARVRLSLGGKIEPKHGAPIDCEGVVEALTDGCFVNKGPMGTGVHVSTGTTARVLVGGGIQVIVTSNRMAPNDAEIFRHIGIEPTDRKILVVKSRGHFRASYEPFAAEILEVDCPGFASPNLKHFDYVKLRRPIFPLDDI
jgi:microcystin degradation protein MlrC